MSNTSQLIAKEHLSNLKKLDNTSEFIVQIKKLLVDYPRFALGWVELGLAYRQTGDRLAALKNFEQALKFVPKNPKIRFELAQEQLHIKDFDESRKNFQYVLQLNPRNFLAIYQLGNLCHQENKREEALSFFQQALQLQPKNIDIIIDIVIELFSSEKFQQAEEYLKQALKYAPNHFRVLLKLGELNQIQQKFKQAIFYFQKACDNHPDNPYPKMKIAMVLRDLQRFEESERLLLILSKQSPDNHNVWIQLGLLEDRKGSTKQALSFFQQALKLQPKNIDIIINIVIKLFDLEQFKQAEEYLKQALKYAPNHFRVLLKLGELNQIQQKFEQAIFYFQKACDNHPDNPYPKMKIAIVLRDLQRFEESERLLLILSKQFPDNHNIWIQLGLLEDQKGAKKQALKWLSQAAKTASNPTETTNARIQYLRMLKDLGCFDEALLEVDQIISKDTRNIRAQMIKGSILQQKSDLLAAATVYKNILSHDSHHLDSRIELAKVYSFLGQVKKAIAFLEKTRTLLGENFSLLIQLGNLNQDIENWQQAHKYYQKASLQYPENHHGYCRLADFFFAQGDISVALKLLQKARIKLPNAVTIIAKMSEFNKCLGDTDFSHKIVEEGLNRFPNHQLLLWQLCHLHLNQGNFSDALKVINLMSADSQDWQSRIYQATANIYFDQYEYQKAEQYFKKSIALTTVSTNKRELLAAILMLTGRIDQARQELKQATQELSLKNSLGKLVIPLKSHSAMLINEIRINPPMMAKLLATQSKKGEARIVALGDLLKKNSTYFGTALYLAKELRTQDIFDRLQAALSSNSSLKNVACIPKRIVQFWDEPEPPLEVQKVCQSWIDFNPDYEYIRFSFETAIAFLKQHYDKKVLKAFANCDEPATQADFFRLAYLSKMGGFYADADDKCRQSLDTLISVNPELIIIQENFACIGNNFIGCIPHQKIINWAFEQAVENMSYYCNEGPWLKTGPGLLTSAVGNGLIPYLSITDYKMWPRISVLTQTQLRKIISQHNQLPYKKTDKNWKNNAYHSRVKAIANAP